MIKIYSASSQILQAKPLKQTARFFTAILLATILLAGIMPLTLFAQAPAISYASPQTYTFGTALSTLTPGNTGGAVPADGYSNTPVLLASGLNVPAGIAVNAVSVYVASSGNGAIYQIPVGGGPPVTLASGFFNPVGLALDAAWVYVADAAKNEITKIPMTGGPPIVISHGVFTAPAGVALDAAGNIYVISGGGLVSRIPSGGGPPGAIASGFVSPCGLAFDAAGNLYVADAGNSTVSEIPAGGGAPVVIGTGFNQLTGVALDGNGNVFVTFNNTISEIPAGGGAPLVVGAGFNLPTAVALYGGDFYVISKSNSTLTKTKQVSGFSISPFLPAGLSFNNATGAISGTPTAASPATDYTVTAFNSEGSGTAPLNITVNLNHPPVISYASPQTYTVGTPISTLTPGNTGSAIPAPGYNNSPATLASGFGELYGMATDAAGNVYVADINTSQVEKIPYSGGIYGAPIPLHSGFFISPYGVAVDASGNVYVADAGFASIEEIPAGGGAVVAIGSGLNKPFGVAVDAAGNVYASGLQGTDVYKIPYSGGTYGAQASIGTGFSSPRQIAVDAAGNVYVDDYGNSEIKEIPYSGGTYGVPVAFASFSQPQGVAVDAAGNVYVGGASQTSVTEILAGGGGQVSIGSGFSSPEGIAVDGAGNVYVADEGYQVAKKINPVSGYYISPFLPAGLRFNNSTGAISGPPTAASPATSYMVTAYNSEGSGTAPLNITVNPTLSPAISYASPQTYTVGTPISTLTPGNTGGAVPADGYSNTPVLLASGLNVPGGVAVNASSVYVTSSANGVVYKIPKSGGPPVTLASGFNYPVGLAFDGAYVYVADAGANAIKRFPIGGGTPVVIGSGFNAPAGVALDAAGNIYVISGGGAVSRIPSGGGPAATIASGFVSPSSLAFDAAGNLYVADAGNSTVSEIPAGGGAPVVIGTGFNQLTGVALDVYGNVFVTYGYNTISEIPAGGGAPLVVGTGFNQPTGVALDGVGDFYVISQSNSTLTKTKQVSGFYISPFLPAGLYFNNTTGAISGTPTAVSPATNYTVTALNSGGSGTAPLNIKVNLPSPIITNFSPATGPAGTLVTITGAGLSSPTALTIGGQSAIVISNDGSTLVAMVMPNATTGGVSITTALGTASGSGNFTVIPTAFPLGQPGNKLVGAISSGSEQGYTVALSADGSTAIAGGFNDAGGIGAAWVYTVNNGVWTQQGPKLVGSGNIGNSQQGTAIALSADGNTAIVGGSGDNSGQGAAWVYARSGGVWTQQAKLLASDNSGFASQGQSVSISADGNTAIVGGYLDNNAAGAAWIYTRSGGAWAQQGLKLVATGSSATGEQGYSVSLSADGNTALVGASQENNGQGAAWVYTRSGATWTQLASKLSATDNTGDSAQGYSVALSADGNTAIVGGADDNSAIGAAWVYTLSNGAFIQQGSKLVGTGGTGVSVQGQSVALSADGNTAIVGGNNDNSRYGAAWVYKRSGGVWTQLGAKLVGAGAIGAPNQGNSVSISADGNTILSGGPADNAGQGAAWVFTATAPTITTFSPATGPAGTLVTITGVGLGSPTALTIGGQSAIVISNDGSTLVAMVMPNATTGGVSITTALGTASGSGNFTVIPTAFPLGQPGNKLVGAISSGSEQGYTVALSADGSTAIAGGFNDAGGIGAAWVYTVNNGVWTQQGPKLVGSGNIGNSQQGTAIALSADGNTAIVGGSGDNSGQGAAWVYARSGGVWTQQAKLLASDNSGFASQGQSVSISADGNTAIVGGYLDNNAAGAAWIYTRSGGAWAQQGLKLVATGSSATGEQGYSVSLSADGNTALVGASQENNGQGAAWVYTRSGATWTQLASKLSATDNTGDSAQGYSVALSADGNTAIVGGADDNSAIGAAWVYTLSNGAFIQQGSKLVGTGGTGVSVQGQSVALSADGNTAIVGGNNDNSRYGAAWVYKRSGGIWTQLGAKLVGAGAIGAPNQGNSVSISADGNTILSGGPADNAGQGAAWVFTDAPKVAISAPSVTVANSGTAINYTVTFTDANMNTGSLANFKASQINAIVTGTAVIPPHIKIGSYTQSGNNYSFLVTFSGETGDGTLRFNIPAGVVSNNAGMASAASDTSASVTIDNTPPTVTIGSPSQSTTSTGPVSYSVTYADANFNTGTLTTGNITLNKTGTANGTVGVSGSGTSYTVTISGITGAGTLGISIAAGTASDLAGNLAPAAVPSATFAISSYDATLGSLSTSAGTLSPLFTSGHTTYTESVPGTTTGITVKPTANSTNAKSITVTAGGVTNTVPSGSSSPAIALAIGANIITVKITAQDGVTTDTYTITVTRAGSSNANLSNLVVLSSCTLKPSFSTNTTSYTASVSNSVISVTVTPITQDPTATVKVNGTTVKSGSASGSIALIVGANTITIVVTAQDGITIKTYTVIVTRAPSSNANLSNLAISPGTLTPAFSTNTTAYSATVSNTTTSLTVTPTNSDPTATIKVNGTTVISGKASGAIALAVGKNTINTVVTAQDGKTTKTYCITVTRTGSAIATLSKLAISSGTLTPVFASGTTSYAASVTNATTSITVTPTTSDPTATVKVNGKAVTSGKASGSIALAVGKNIITTVVTAQNGTTTDTYTVTVTRASGPLKSLYMPVSVVQPTENLTIENDGVMVHQGVSPNGDGINDILTIDGITAYPDNKLTIIDRSGSLVFEGMGYNNISKVFDGHSTVNGRMQQPGTYFYSLDYVADGRSKHKTGYIILKY